MSYGYIYLIKDHLNNKIYVGRRKGLAENSKDYFGSGTIISRIIKKRKHHLSKIIIGYCNSLEELIEAETECIHFFRAFGSDGVNHDEIYGYNLKPTGEDGGGIKGLKFSESHKQNMSKALKGKNKGKKNSLGYKHTKESKQKMSKAKKHNNYTLGYKHTQAAKNKISKSHMGNKNCNYRKDLDLYINDIILMRRSGYYIKDIASQFNCSCTAIKNRLKGI